MTEVGKESVFRPEMLRIRDIVQECERQAIQPQDGDVYIASIAEATSTLLTERMLGNIVLIALDFRHEERPTALNMFNVIRCAMQKQLVRHDSEGFPTNGYENPEKVYSAANTFLQDPRIQEELQYDIGLRNVQTNIGERYKSHKLIMSLLEDRLGVNPTFLDIGCSDLQGPKQLRNADIVPFNFISERNTENEAVQTDLTLVLNRIIHSDSGIPGKVVGIDAFRPTLSANMEWIRACTFKPAELARQERTEAFKTLDQLPDRQVQGYWHPFDEMHMQKFAEAVSVQEFDVITFTTMLSQLDESAVENKRALARRYLKPNGILIYQDRFTADPLDQSRLKFLPDFNNYNYRTLIEFGDDPSHALYEVVQWETGRCYALRPGPYLMHLLAGEFS